MDPASVALASEVNEPIFIESEETADMSEGVTEACESVAELESAGNGFELASTVTTEADPAVIIDVPESTAVVAALIDALVLIAASDITTDPGGDVGSDITGVTKEPVSDVAAMVVPISEVELDTTMLEIRDSVEDPSGPKLKLLLDPTLFRSVIEVNPWSLVTLILAVLAIGLAMRPESVAVELDMMLASVEFDMKPESVATILEPDSVGMTIEPASVITPLVSAFVRVALEAESVMLVSSPEAVVRALVPEACVLATEFESVGVEIETTSVVLAVEALSVKLESKLESMVLTDTPRSVMLITELKAVVLAVEPSSVTLIIALDSKTVLSDVVLALLAIEPASDALALIPDTGTDTSDADTLTDTSACDMLAGTLVCGALADTSVPDVLAESLRTGVTTLTPDSVGAVEPAIDEMAESVPIVMELDSEDATVAVSTIIGDTESRTEVEELLTTETGNPS